MTNAIVMPWRPPMAPPSSTSMAVRTARSSAVLKMFDIGSPSQGASCAAKRSRGVGGGQTGGPKSPTMLDLPYPRRYTEPAFVKNSLMTKTYAVLGDHAEGRARDVGAMIIRVSELEEQGLRIDDVAALAPALTDPMWRLESADLLVEADGTDVFVRGDVTATVPQTCGRCLETFPAR